MLRITYHYFIFFLLFLLPTLCFGQAVYEGQVIDKETELAIPSVTVTLVKAKFVTKTNERGYFKLSADNPVDGDALLFSSVGYKTLKLPVSAYQPQMFVTLEATNTQLKEVRITSGKIKTLTLSKFSWRDLHERPTIDPYFTIPFTWFAGCAKQFIIPKDNMRLVSIQLGRRDFTEKFTTTNKNTRFFVHVLAADADSGQPGKTLLTKEVTLTDNASFITIDLGKDKINLETGVYFVAIEWLFIPFNEVISFSGSAKLDKAGKITEIIAPSYKAYYQPALVGYTRYRSDLQWHRLGNMLWGPPLIRLPEFSEMHPPSRIWLKKDDGWHETLSSHEVALSITLNY